MPNLSHMDPTKAPQLIEQCFECGHTQSYHISASGGYLTGHMVACRRDGCHCQHWSSSWTPGYVSR